MLKISNLSVSYGHITALREVTLDVPAGKIVSIIGSNGAGKTTLLNTISSIVKSESGEITYNDQTLKLAPHKIVKKGVVQVPEGRKIFAGLTVMENLTIGGFLYKKHVVKEVENLMFEQFPVLKERKNQMAGTLSGGEQQMLAIARGLMTQPKVMLMDEPSLGLAPLIVKQVFELIKKINGQGITILLVEQNALKALGLCDYAYVLENGKVVLQGEGREVLSNPEVKHAYLGENV